MPYDTTEVGSLLEPQITLIPVIDVEPEIIPEELPQGHFDLPFFQASR